LSRTPKAEEGPARKLDGERTPLPGQHPLTTDKEACAPKCAVSLILVLSDDAKETVRFVCDSGGEEDSGILRQKIPQAVKSERCAIGSHQRLDKSAGVRIVIVDQSVSEVANPKFAIYQTYSIGLRDSNSSSATEAMLNPPSGNIALTCNRQRNLRTKTSY
jgi:hypothetical protein